MSSINDVVISNAKLFIILVTDGTTDEKTENITKCLNEGADVNESFANFSNNTPLHIAVMKEEKYVVNLLLEKGADVTLKNNESRTAMDVARDLNTDAGRKITEILQLYNKKIQEKYVPLNIATSVETNGGINKSSLYQKRIGTTGIKGELYETKVLSLILIRTLLNKRIDQFYLGTSVHGIGALDDVCLRFTEKNKESVVFLQAKHIVKGRVMLKDLWNSTGNYSLSKYFNSYLNIRDKFKSSTNDNMFMGKYEDTKCHFIIYTTAEDEMTNNKVSNQHLIDKTIRDLLSTRENRHIFQYKYDDEDIKLLTKIIVLERMKQMGKRLYQFTQGNKYNNILSDRLISNYQVVIVKKVMAVSQIVVDDARIASFREEFLSSNNESLIVLREAFYNEAVIKTKISYENLVKLVKTVLAQPTADNISKLLQTTPISYDVKSNRLCLLDNKIKELVSLSLFEIVISHTTFNEAFQTAVKEKLRSVNFKLPIMFGNVDFKINKLDIESILNNVALKIENIISQFGDENITIDSKNKIDPSLIGNVLVFDENSRMFKFNTCTESLGKNANAIIEKLKTKIDDLHSFKFQLNTDNIPKISFEADEFENRLAKDFLNNLWFYTRQAKEHEIELYAKYDLLDYYNFIGQEPHNTFSQVQSDAIFFKIHNEVQKWWLLETTQVPYITKNMLVFDKILNNFADNSLLTILNYIYVNEIQKCGIEFSENSIQSLGLDTLTGLTVLQTGHKTLTAIKLYQYFNQMNNYTFVDLSYASRFSLKDMELLFHELKNSNKQTIIIIYEVIANEVINLNNLLISSLAKKIILVVKDYCLEKLTTILKVKEYVTVRDKKIEFSDLTTSSQAKVLQNKLIFQGIEVSFGTLIDAGSQHLITANILSAINKNESLEIGKNPSASSYEEIKDYFVQRTLYRSKKNKTCAGSMKSSDSSSSESEYNEFSLDREEQFKIKTLEDIENTVVLMAAPGMGKSTLLTHLSIETKKKNARVWIERINLLDHVADFYKWQEDKLVIDQLEALRFLCKTVISKNVKSENINFDIEFTDAMLSVTNRDALDCLILFELEVFINCYNKGNTILIFDGFDEICPHYKDYVLQLLKNLASTSFPKSGDNSRNSLKIKQQMWITSRPYNDIEKTLQTEFGISYRLKPFSDIEQSFFVEKYLRMNLNLKGLNYEQFQNIDTLFEYMRQFSDLYKDMNTIMLIKSTSAPLHSLYCAAIEYFRSEISIIPLSGDKTKFKDKWISNIRLLKASELLVSWKHVSEEAMNLARTPLHTYLVINYIETKIKNLDTINLAHKWDLDINTFTFYEKFLETKLKKIRFEEKNHIDLQNPDLQITYERERIEFVTKHKKLAFYAVFKNHADKILDSREIHDIQQAIRRIENGEEKTGLIEYVVNGVPKFVHLTFAEYLAVEYITDLLKTYETHEEKAKVFEFILHVVLSTWSTGVLEIFDRKINCDQILFNIISDLDLKQFVCDYLTYNDPYSSQRNFSCRAYIIEKVKVNYIICKSPLDIAVYYGMKNLAKFLLVAITEKVSKENLDQFINALKIQAYFRLSVKCGYNELLELILNCVKRVDERRLHEIYINASKGGSELPAIGNSNGEIIDYLKTIVHIEKIVHQRWSSKKSLEWPIKSPATDDSQFVKSSKIQKHTTFCCTVG